MASMTPVAAAAGSAVASATAAVTNETAPVPKVGLYPRVGFYPNSVSIGFQAPPSSNGTMVAA